MQEWLKKIIETGKDVQVTYTLQDAYDELYEICEREHSSCNTECPVYAKCVEDGEFKLDEHNPCPYFKNGRKMFERLNKNV